MSDDDDADYWKQKDAEDAELATAENNLATAIRQYLWEMVRITGSPQWETEPDFALLAVIRVMARQIYQPKPEQGTNADFLLQDVIDELSRRDGRVWMSANLVLQNERDRGG
jgi:hypothetical protein